MKRILYAIAVTLRLDKLHKAMLDAVIETRVKNALQTSDKLRKEQDRLREKDFRKQLDDLQNNHNSSFENYKLETENLIRIFKNQILVRKKRSSKRTRSSSGNATPSHDPRKQIPTLYLTIQRNLICK